MFYKYFGENAFNYTLKGDGVNIRLSQPDVLNDIFEMKGKNTLREGELDFDNRKNKSDIFANESGIISLSKKKNSSPLWAYYGEDHKGFMIEFKESIKNFQSEKSNITYKEVIYDRQRPSSVYDEFENHKDNITLAKIANMKTIMENIFFTKSLEWSHEDEYRIVFYNATKASNRKITLDSKGYEIRSITYPFNEISGIYLGVRSGDILTRKVLFWSRKYANIPVYKAKTSPESFEIEYEQIS